jgi:NtrC-family two-component system sensor histidine kinase KinB
VVTRVRRTATGVRFEVQDSGEGIPPQYQERVFERFFQVPGARRGGVGLGLYISREVVRAHGGEMGARSEVGQGSTFWFTLPALPSADA